MTAFITTEELSENSILKGTENVILKGMSKNSAWEIAADAVDYPVHITNAYYQKDGEFVNANGLTTNGRSKYFNLVVVDKLRNGDLQTVAAPTGLYGTLITKDAYRDLKEQLEEIEQAYNVHDLYVSYNGGSQSLTIEFEGMSGLNNLPDEITMRVRLNTSVDGTSYHSLSMVAYNKTGDTSTNVYGGDFKLAARHTTTLGARTIDFIPQIARMISHWNDTLMPTMELMLNKKFDRKIALEIVDGLSKDAGVAEKHRVRIAQLFESGNIRTNDISNSLYKVHATIGQYIEDELEDSRGLQERLRNGLAKSVKKYL